MYNGLTTRISIDDSCMVTVTGPSFRSNSANVGSGSPDISLMNTLTLEAWQGGTQSGSMINLGVKTWPPCMTVAMGASEEVGMTLA